MATERKQFDAVAHVTVPSVCGQSDIYPDHAESYMLLEEGEIEIITDKGESLKLHVTDGGAAFRENHLSVFVAS